VSPTPSGPNTLIGGVIFDGSFPASGPDSIFTGPDGFGGTLVTVACFAAGTRMATARGEFAVEALDVGDLMLTASGGRSPVLWLGHRHVDCRGCRTPQALWPVRVSAGAFGPDRPARALYLSPDHAVLADNVLIPVRHLVNGRSITQVPVDGVSYYHVELPRHEVLLAAGLPCESYLDTGNRSNFANAAGPVALHPEFSSLVLEAEGRAPLIVTGPELDLVRQRVNTLAAAVMAQKNDKTTEAA
jgi:hypothetical protein